MQYRYRDLDNFEFNNLKDLKLIVQVPNYREDFEYPNFSDWFLKINTGIFEDLYIDYDCDGSFLDEDCTGEILEDLNGTDLNLKSFYLKLESYDEAHIELIVNFLKSQKNLERLTILGSGIEGEIETEIRDALKDFVSLKELTILDY